MSPAVIEVENLTKIYDGIKVVDSLTFRVEKGSLCALLGPNGAGKTTTVEILEGYRKPDSGSVRVLGHDPWSTGGELKKRVGLMLQEGGVYPGIRVAEAARLFGSYYDNPVSVDEAIASVGLTGYEKRKVRGLSGGEKQRLNLALALIGKPEVLFLDEPTSGMDPHARASTWERIQDLKRSGVSILLTTHFLEEAENLADTVAIIDEGRLIEEGQLADLLSVGKHFEFKTDQPIDAASLSDHLGAKVVSNVAMSYVVEAAPTPSLIALTADFVSSHQALITELKTGRVSLESVFMKLTSTK
ncbi:MAG: ABC transporter ATP-binding protein [Actinobacteria bacterium]|nr:ABC transporter ATP-binding protein [Actinomycetota bacterium]